MTANLISCILNIRRTYRHVLNDIGASAYADVFTSAHGGTRNELIL